ncbi:hypothetical protein AG1IA_04988 [Rhizoctonia solani AG-1 IA]|uniref:Uncharacterized protein n=1 Tax=Thanatephorus cucumeris (strain AG1-IA) TaxID=983506 RepID=L8WXA5_THACA|nr:hypothetical protein AG1IA_04988 [Rhizoctonia solani AG-1 IA]
MLLGDANGLDVLAKGARGLMTLRNSITRGIQEPTVCFISIVHPIIHSHMRVLSGIKHRVGNTLYHASTDTILELSEDQSVKSTNNQKANTRLVY